MRVRERSGCGRGRERRRLRMGSLLRSVPTSIIRSQGLPSYFCYPRKKRLSVSPRGHPWGFLLVDELSRDRRSFVRTSQRLWIRGRRKTIQCDIQRLGRSNPNPTSQTVPRNRGDYGRRQRSRQRARGTPATDSRLLSLPPARPCWSESVPSLSAAAAIVIPEVCLCPHRSVVSSRSLRQEMHLPSCSPSWPSIAPLAPDPAVRALDRVELAILVLTYLHGFPRSRASVRLVLSPGTRGCSNPFIR